MIDMEKPQNNGVDLFGKETYYDILNISPYATKAEIKEAYIMMKNIYNSKNTALYSLIDEEESNENLLKIEEAYKTLNNEIYRKEYDKSIGKINEQLSVANISTHSNKKSFSAFHGIGDNVEVFKSMMDKENVFEDNTENVGVKNSSTAIFSKKLTLSNAKSTVADKTKSEDFQNQITELLKTEDVGDGTLYKKIRELAGVKLEEIQEAIKASRQYISAIETNDYQHLPQLIFAKGFLRSYLRYLSVKDEGKLVTAFGIKYKKWEEEQNK